MSPRIPASRDAAAPSGRANRLLGGSLLALNAAFVLLTLAAMGTYPGGTWMEPERVGHSLWHNFLCDLLHTQSLNGGDNHVGAGLAQSAMLLETLALTLLWWGAPLLYATRRSGARLTRALGVTSACGVVAVVMLPSDRFGALHGMAVVVASGPAFAAALVCSYSLLQSGHRRAGSAGVGALVVAVTSFVLYARAQYFGATLTAVVPATQRVATLALIAFSVLVARDLLAHSQCRQHIASR
ncbi:MAG: hypothetical protein R3B13_32100 [Polyangiaceae bacterium]